jgi:hypothetical protein
LNKWIHQIVRKKNKETILSHENGYIVPWLFSIHQIVVLYTCPTKWLHHSSSEEDNINLQKFVFGIPCIAICHVYNTRGTTCNFQTVKILRFIVALYLKYLCAMGNDQDALNASSVSCNIIYKHILPYVKTKSSPTHTWIEWLKQWLWMCWVMFLSFLVCWSCFHPNLDLGCSYLPKVAILNILWNFTCQLEKVKSTFKVAAR